MAKPLEKSSGRSWSDLRVRVTRRSKKWTKQGEGSESLPPSANSTTSSDERLESIQANNRALALALQKEKCKGREAQNALLYLKEMNYCLKLHIFYLEALLQSQQLQTHAENAGAIPSVPLMIPVTPGQEFWMGVPQHSMEREGIQKSETKAAADDNKPSGCVSEDHCESARADDMKEVDQVTRCLGEMESKFARSRRAIAFPDDFYLTAPNNFAAEKMKNP